jgi:hypothetical protein
MKVTNRLKEKLPDNTLLTRYIDIHSFLYFITQNKLRFARLDTFEDLNEGFSVDTADAVRGVTDRSKAIKSLTDKEQMLQGVTELKKQHFQLQEHYWQYQKNLFACCWYMGEKESVAMWNLYSNADSVAIRFKATQLIELLSSMAERDDQHFAEMQYGTVEYADLATTGKALQPGCVGFLKDDSFRHEQEFRFMAQRNAEDDVLEYEVCIGDLKKIDFAVISHPKMEEWKIRNILNVLSFYQLTDKFQPSELTLKNL